MYTRFAESNDWSVELLNVQQGAMGGFTSVEFLVVGEVLIHNLNMKQESIVFNEFQKLNHKAEFIHHSSCDSNARS